MDCKKIFVIALSFVFSTIVFAQNAQDVKSAALEKASADETVEYILSHISSNQSDSERRSLLSFVAGIQELCGDWMGAAESYNQAAHIVGYNESGFPQYTGDYLYLCAARCYLNFGDSVAAEKSLNSITDELKDYRLVAQKNLYHVWAELSQCILPGETKNSLDRLKSYLELDSMKSVRSSILFTLWYVGGDEKYAEILKASYPKSPEASLVDSKTKLFPSPFWCFVPRSLDEPSVHYENKSTVQSGDKKNQVESKPLVQEKSDKSVTDKMVDKKTSVSSPKNDSPKTEKESETKKKTESPKSNQVEEISRNEKITREQLGLFRSKKNAEDLVLRVKEKGFNAYYYSETRASGTTYYIVVVDENKENTIGKKLRAAGFDCYPVE